MGDGDGRWPEVTSALYPKGLRKLEFKVIGVLVYELMCDQAKKKLIKRGIDERGIKTCH